MLTVSDNGTAWLTCQDAILHNNKRHAVVIEWRRRDGIWDREAVARTPTLNGSLHEVVLAWDDSAAIVVRGRIDPDPWVVVSGRITLNIAPAQDGSEAGTADDAAGAADGADGTYRGAFADTEISGSAVLDWQPAPAASRGASAVEPAILDDFRTHGSAGRLYDFSHAGRGTTNPCSALPVLNASDYGVVGDSGEEALPALQAAVDAAGEMGGAVVQLPAGVIDCNLERKHPALRLRRPNVVVRGAGSHGGGTVLVNHRYTDSPIPSQPWLAGAVPLIHLGPDADDTPEPLTLVSAGQRGSATITVADASQLRVGDTVVLRQLETADGSLAADLVQHQVEVASNYRGEGTELVSQLALITALDGTQVTLDAPLHRSVGRWPVELCRYPMVAGVGVCDLLITGHWSGYFEHHKSPEHDNGWDQIRVDRIVHGWVSNVIHEHCTTAVSLHSCLGCVVSDCRIQGNPGHNGFNLTMRSTGNLFERCHGARAMHAFNVQGRICGNAIVDCSMDEGAGIDLHGGIGYDNLFDNLRGGVNRGGGGGGAVPPRHGPQLVLWNWSKGAYNPYKLWQQDHPIADERQMPGFIAVGCHSAFNHPLVWQSAEGVTDQPAQTATAWVESPGQRVTPRSLRAWQLAQR